VRLSIGGFTPCLGSEHVAGSGRCSGPEADVMDKGYVFSHVCASNRASERVCWSGGWARCSDTYRRCKPRCRD
jgi:hypothetical protein